jgi:hypothetical protein
VWDRSSFFAKRILPFLLLLSLFVLGLMPACGRGSIDTTVSSNQLQTRQVITVTPVPGQSATPAATPSPTATLTENEKAYYEFLATRPREMEAYLFVYDPKATPQLPPPHAIHMPIWGRYLPLRAFDYTPRFITYPKPTIDTDVEALLVQAGCTQVGYWDIECTPESPLVAFGCDDLLTTREYTFGLAMEQNVLALCRYWPEDPEEPREAYLFRNGCAFRADVGYILQQDGEYLLVSTPEQLKRLMLPIDSPEKALEYVELMTGLFPTFSFEAKPELLWFQDPVEGTRITEKDGVYTLNLFHYQGCLCEPWLNTEVYVSVDREGKISWLGGVPLSMTISMSCAD